MNRTAALLGAAALAVTAAVLLKQGLSREVDRRLAGEEPVSVVVAERDILPGQPLTRSDIMPVEIPKRALAPSTITAEHGTELLGQSLVRPRRAGEQLSWFDVAERGRGLASAVPAGHRAVTVSVDERGGLSGMLKPNDRVDVLFIVSQPPAKENGAEKVSARLLLPNVTVLAVGGRTGLDAPAEDSYGTVTLACTPEESAALALAQSKGELTLVLRNPEDASSTSGLAVDLDDLLSGRTGSDLAKRRQERIERYERGVKQ